MDNFDVDDHIAKPCTLSTEISQGGTTLKRKFEGEHDNENGTDSPNNVINDSDVNGKQHDNIENTPPPPPPSPEVSRYFIF